MWTSVLPTESDSELAAGCLQVPMLGSKLMCTDPGKEGVELRPDSCGTQLAMRQCLSQQTSCQYF